MDEIFLTQQEFDDLLNYSCSYPTGTTIGKRWKSCEHYRRQKDPNVTWFMGEYVEHPKPKTVGIVWRKIIIVGERQIDKDIEKFMRRSS